MKLKQKRKRRNFLCTIKLFVHGQHYVYVYMFFLAFRHLFCSLAFVFHAIISVFFSAPYAFLLPIDFHYIIFFFCRLQSFRSRYMYEPVSVVYNPKTSKDIGTVFLATESLTISSSCFLVYQCFSFMLNWRKFFKVYVLQSLKYQ